MGTLYTINYTLYTIHYTSQSRLATTSPIEDSDLGVPAATD